MPTFFISLAIFLASYTLATSVTSICYHRALCHNALTLNPGFKKFIFRWGFIITAIDPLLWICTHRLHHLYADTQKDPHGPKFYPGLAKMNNAHLVAYSYFNQEFRTKNSKSWEVVKDLGLELHPLMRLPNIPLLGISWGNAIIYTLHLILYLSVYLIFKNPWYPLALAAGLLIHPLQGVVVNYFAHKEGGYRNFPTNDDSINHQLIAIFIFGEGYQNNHHHDPSNPKFSVKKGEYDFGHVICKLMRKLSLVSF